MAQLKFPKFENNVEYFDVQKNKQTLLSLKSPDVSGKTWRQVQELIGDKLGTNSFRYTLKFKNDSKIYNGTIRSVASNPEKDKTLNDNKVLSEALITLTEKIEAVSKKSAPESSLIIEVLKDGHNQRVEMLNEKLKEKVEIINKLELKIVDYEKELTEQDGVIDELREKSGYKAWLNIAQEFLKGRMGQAQTLSDEQIKQMSNTTDIPKPVIDLLGIVDWLQVDNEDISNILNYLNIFIQKLPMKG